MEKFCDICKTRPAAKVIRIANIDLFGNDIEPKTVTYICERSCIPVIVKDVPVEEIEN